MPAGNDTDVSERLLRARELLSQGMATEAQQAIDGVLVLARQLPDADMVHSCGLLARLLALRGEGTRARLLAALAVEASRYCTTGRHQAYAFLDKAHTLRTLGDADESLACLRRAHSLAPREIPSATWREKVSLVS